MPSRHDLIDAKGIVGTLRPTRADAPSEEPSWSAFFGMVKRRWLIFAIALVLAVGAASAYLATTPALYEGAASLLIQPEQYNLPEVVKRDEMQDPLDTETELLRSGELTRVVVRDLGLTVSVLEPSRVARSRLLDSLVVDPKHPAGEVLLRRVPGGFAVTSSVLGQRVDTIRLGERISVGGVSFGLGPDAIRQRTIRLGVGSEMAATIALQEGIKLGRPARNGNLIQIRYRSIDPAIASRVPDRLAEAYLEHRIEAARSKVRTAVAFLRNEADSLRRQLLAAETDLQRYRERQGIVSLPEEAVSAVAATAELQNSRVSIESERAALARLVTAARNDRKSGPSPYRRLTAFPTLIKNPMISELLGSLGRLENERSELLVRRTVKDPDVIANGERIAAVDAQLQALTNTYLDGLESQVGALDRAIRAQTSVASSIPRKGAEEARLARQPRVLGEIYSLVETRLQEARLAESAADPGARIIDRAGIPEEPVWPRRGLILAVAIAIGLFGGGALAWMRESLDSAVHSRADVARAADVKVLGFVPRTGVLRDPDTTTRIRLVSRRESERPDPAVLAAEEAYTWILTTLALNADPERPLRSLVMTSPLSREGKTINSVNLAISIGRSGRRVLLIDGDLRRGRIHDVLGVSRRPGMAELLAGRAEPEQVIQRVAVGGIDSIDVISCGKAAAHPHDLLRSPRTREMIARFEEEFDMVIVDSPPVNLVSDALFLGRVVDGVLLVARAGQTDGSALTDAAEHLREADTPLLGVLLNDIDLRRDGSYDDAYRYLHQAGSYAAGTP